MSEPELVNLRADRIEAVLAPAVGGCIAALDFVGEEGPIRLLRGERRVPPHVLEAGSFPLVPYVNRIRGGIFVFRGREIRLETNMPPDPSPLHGQGWLSAWEVASRSDTEAELRFSHAAGEWPWDYDAHQRFAIDRAGLSVALSCTNRSSEPMPCGLGQHPYFPCADGTQLDTEVRWAWTVDDKVLPVDKVPAEGRYGLSRRRICGQGLDNGFGEWGGRARMVTPGQPFAVEISSAEAHFFQVYSPAAGGFFVAEPVTHANAALNAPEPEWPQLGLRVLAPGESMTLSMRIEIRP